jgi:uncharacterized membrane protein
MSEDFQPKPRSLWVVTLIFGIVVIADSWFRWSTFQYRTFDLAFYVHTFWLTLHGQAHSTILDVSLMGNHAEPICYLLLPFFWIWKHPMVLVVLQTLIVMTMPFTGYRIARRLEFERRGALWLGLATLIAPATGFMALHEFHPETLAAPLLLLMLEARLAQRPGTFWVWFLLALACKENVALLLAWLCAVHYILERNRGREWQMLFNVIPGVVAAAWLAMYVFWLGPMWNGGKVDYNELYSHVGGVSGVFKSPGTTVSSAWNAVVEGNLVWGLLLPFVLLPLLRPRWLIIAAPIFAQHLLSNRPSEWTIYFHYAAPLLPLMWFAAAESCARLFWRDVMAGWILFASAACQLWLGPARVVARNVMQIPAAREFAAIRHEFLDSIPDNASVVAGLPYLSHLAQRERVYSLHHILKGLKTLSRERYVHPEGADIVLVDVGDGATFDRESGYYHPLMKTKDGTIVDESEVLLEKFLSPHSWRSISRNEVTMLLRDSAVPRKPATGAGEPLDGKHRLLSTQFAPPPAGDLALILLTMEIQGDRTLLPWATLYLQSENSLYAIAKGPLGLGQGKNVLVNESWAIRRPRGLPEGKYQTLLLFHDNHESQFPEKSRFEKRAFKLGELTVPK